MNRMISKGDGKRIRQKQGRIAAEDFDPAEREFENLYRFLEERYGYSRGKAKEEVDRRIRK